MLNMKSSKHVKIKYVKNNDAHTHLLSLSVGSRLVMQCKDGEPWTHTVIKKANISDHR